MSRVYNFSAGPAVLPEEVLKEAAKIVIGFIKTRYPGQLDSAMKESI